MAITSSRQPASHPPGLYVLFFTEMWERYSFYSMMSILVLYMDEQLKFSHGAQGQIYGGYIGAVYFTPLLGGFIADKWWGYSRTIIVGGLLITLGHFALAFETLPLFFAALGLLSVGTGLLKPNVSTMVGHLYSKDDPRRDAGFSIFYMGINLGAFIAPLVCGFLAQGEWFKGFLGRVGFHSESSWHWGPA